MNTLKICAMALILVRLAVPFQAEAGEGFYAGGSIGSANLDDDFDGFEIDDDTTAYRIVGGWWVNRYFALEAGYQNFGDFEQDVDIGSVISSVSLSADGFTLGATGSVPLSEQFSLFGRAGWFFWAGDAEINNVSQATPEDSNLYLGAGISYAVNDRFQVIGDWSRYDLDGVNSSVASIGIQFSFGN